MRYGIVTAVGLLIACLATGAGAAKPPNVLLIHSFGRDFAPYDAITSVFRAELARESSLLPVVHEVTLDAGRSISADEEKAMVEYLSARFAKAAPDLVVTIGPLAARFYLDYRERLFQATPLLLAALDERLARRSALRPSDAAVLGSVDFPRLFNNMLQLLPETKTIAVVMGASELEKFWLGQVQKEIAPLAGRVNFLWLNDLSLEGMRERVANLPANSVVFYGLLVMDAVGVPHVRQEALERLRAVSGAPIFGIYESELGKGTVGGPYTSQRQVGEQTAAAALRLLNGKLSAGPEITVVPFESPVYDWRELRRWKIDPSRLPPGSDIRFRPPSLWDEHKLAIIAAVAILLLQTTLIAALLWQRVRRRHAESEARNLGGRLITAHEDERRRIARELHDDISQRLAAMAIQAVQLGGAGAGRDREGAASSLCYGLASLGDDIHSLSRRLHPKVVEDLGLIEALRAECDRVAQSDSIHIALDLPDERPPVRTDAAVGLYRVAQEALRNVVRHAAARDVRVSLRVDGRRLVLVVADQGIGFDASRGASHAGIGIASMGERMRLLNGGFSIETARGHGTKVAAWIPLQEVG